jgi:hypothetical protein
MSHKYYRFLKKGEVILNGDIVGYSVVSGIDMIAKWEKSERAGEAVELKNVGRYMRQMKKVAKVKGSQP